MRLILEVILILTMCIPATSGNPCDIRFEGTIVKMSPQTFESGLVTSYRLVLYEVTHVVSGSYGKRQIVVDHLVLKSNDLNQYRPGEVVCVCVRRKHNLKPRFNAKGIREPNDKIPWYFVAEDIKSGECATGDRP